MKRLVLLACLACSCARGPGLTPFEQNSLEILTAPHRSALLYTVDQEDQQAATLLAVFDEFRRTPLMLDIVWRTAAAPTTEQLARFPGKRIRQYWDPRRLTPSSQGRLLVNGQSVEEELLTLRLALARAAAQPQASLPLH